MGIDILGVDILGVDILGIDIPAPTQNMYISFVASPLMKYEYFLLHLVK